MRLLKWVGDPPAVRADGWRVANWKHENMRVIAIPGFSHRVIQPYDIVKNPDGTKSAKPNGLSREYVWDKNLPNFVLEVEDTDAQIILGKQPHEFRDVTGMTDSEITNTRNKPIMFDDSGKRIEYSELIIIP